MPNATVVLVGTLDTKGTEYGYLRDRIREAGADVLLVDAGVLGEPLLAADIPREEVARAAGADHAELRAAADRGRAVDVMGRGAGVVLGSDVTRVHRTVAALAAWMRAARSGHPPRMPRCWSLF